MFTRSMILAAAFAVTAGAAFAEGEGNNLAAVEIPASNGIYNTTNYVAPATPFEAQRPAASRPDEVALAPAPRSPGH